MIIKSYIFENEPEKIAHYNSILFYGINLGLKKFFKDTIKVLNKNNLVLNFTQDEIINNNELILKELNNTSLFEEKKL